MYIFRRSRTFFNPADLLTKHLAETPMLQCLEFLDFTFLDGRHPVAPMLAGSDEVDINARCQCSRGEAEWSTIRHGCFVNQSGSQLTEEGRRNQDGPRGKVTYRSVSGQPQLERACRSDSADKAMTIVKCLVGELVELIHTEMADYLGN